MSTQVKQEMPKMVRIDDDVHAALTKVGMKGESYSDIIKRLVDFYNKKAEKK